MASPTRPILSSSSDDFSDSMEENNEENPSQAVHPSLLMAARSSPRICSVENAVFLFVAYTIFYDAFDRLHLPHFAVSLMFMQLSIILLYLVSEKRRLKRTKAEVVVGRVLKRWTNSSIHFAHHLVVQYSYQGKTYQKRFIANSLVAEEEYLELWIPNTGDCPPMEAQLQLMVDRRLHENAVSRCWKWMYILSGVVIPFYCLRTDLDFYADSPIGSLDVAIHYILAACAFPLPRLVMKKINQGVYDDAFLIETDPENPIDPINQRIGRISRIDQRLLLEPPSSNTEILLRNIGFVSCVSWFAVGQSASGLEYYWCLYIFAMLSASTIASLISDFLFVAPLRRRYRDQGIPVSSVTILRRIKLSSFREGSDAIVEYKVPVGGRVITAQKRLLMQMNGLMESESDTDWRVLPGHPWSVWNVASHNVVFCRFIGIFLSPCILFSFATFDLHYGMEFSSHFSSTTPLLALVGVGCFSLAHAVSTRQLMLGEGILNSTVVRNTLVS